MDRSSLGLYMKCNNNIESIFPGKKISREDFLVAEWLANEKWKTIQMDLWLVRNTLSTDITK